VARWLLFSSDINLLRRGSWFVARSSQLRIASCGRDVAFSDANVWDETSPSRVVSCRIRFNRPRSSAKEKRDTTPPRGLFMSKAKSDGDTSDQSDSFLENSRRLHHYHPFPSHRAAGHTVSLTFHSLPIEGLRSMWAAMPPRPKPAARSERGKPLWKKQLVVGSSHRTLPRLAVSLSLAVP